MTSGCIFRTPMLQTCRGRCTGLFIQSISGKSHVELGNLMVPLEKVILDDPKPQTSSKSSVMPTQDPVASLRRGSSGGVCIAAVWYGRFPT